MIRRPSQRTTTARFRAGIALAAAAIVLIAGVIQRVAVDNGYRHTRAVTATVLQVASDRIASVSYAVDGRTVTAPLDVSTQSGVDVGDRLALRLTTTGNGRLTLAASAHTIVYELTTLALIVIAGSFLFQARARRRHELHQIRRSWLSAIDRLHT
jgi:hypothetical protein